MFLFIPKNINEVYSLRDYYDGLILSLENFSVNYPSFSFDEIKRIIMDFNDKKIFVNLNKNMNNNDFVLLRDILRELECLDIDGIFYYDLSVLNTKCDLVWSVCHMTCNYETCNFWFKRGVKYCFLSNEITFDEINEISKNTDMELMVQVFGYVPIFTSKRHIVKNYIKSFDLKDNSKVNYIKHNDLLYPIIDNDETVVFNNSILNSIDEIDKFKSMGIKYFIINSFLIENIEDVLRNFKDNKKFNVENEGKGFLYEETIYRVKK